MVPLRYRQISEQQFAAIGRFVVEFSVLESSIKLGIAMLIRLPDGIYDEVLAGYDFATACNVLEAVGAKQMSAADHEALVGSLKRARRVNDERNRVAHGTWQLFGDFRARHVSRQKLRPSEHFKDHKELLRLADDAKDLNLAIYDICRANADATWLQQED